jgi:hypothetical protein
MEMLDSTIFNCLIYKGYGGRVSERNHKPGKLPRPREPFIHCLVVRGLGRRRPGYVVRCVNPLWPRVAVPSSVLVTWWFLSLIYITISSLLPGGSWPRAVRRGGW